MGRWRDKARMLQRFRGSNAIGQWSDAQDNSSFESCSSFPAFDIEEDRSDSSEMTKDMDEAMSGSSWTALARGRERDWWSSEPEGEVEKPEVIGLWSATEGVSTDPEGEGSHSMIRTKITREHREEQMKVERETDDKASWEVGAEIQSPKRKVIRVESEEAQDYVRD